ncbi:MAG: hypothetical protein J2P17_19785, partial [Mycobacterium sp.]|nr:hypothetical protein [Mycobacterium sp.]
MTGSCVLSGFAGSHKLKHALGLLLDVSEAGRGKKVDERMSIEHVQPKDAGASDHGVSEGRR